MLLFFAVAACRVLLTLLYSTYMPRLRPFTTAELSCGEQVTVVCAVPSTPNDTRFTGEGEGSYEPDATTMYEASFW